MAISYDHIMSLKSEGIELSYGDRETMLYALGIGFGRDPMNEAELPFVYEGVNDPAYLKTVPTMATVLQWGGGAMRDSGINYLMVVHGEQRVQLHRPLPSAASIVSDERVIGAFDKGAGKGAVIVTEKKIRIKGTNEPLATLVSSTFARGDGGFGGPSTGAPEPHPIPERKPDGTFETTIEADQAFIYALSGDRNPLHRDPKIAKMAGFQKPDHPRAVHLRHDLPGDHHQRAGIQVRGDRRLRRAVRPPPIPARRSWWMCGRTAMSSRSAPASRSAKSSSSTTASAR